jgi:hypothetical protein
MVIDNVGINEEFWGGKTFAEFEKGFKGKLRSDKIKIAYDKLPKVPKPKKVLKPKEEENK